LRNEDPISGEAGAHPVGSGLGAAIGGATTGAVAGAVAGPIGTVAGAIVGGIAGGLAGKAIAENYDPTVESEYWRNEYKNRDYYNDTYGYESYEPAYRAGWESYDRDVDWVDREANARQRWENEGGSESMSWDEAKFASQDAYDRIHRAPTRRPR